MWQLRVSLSYHRARSKTPIPRASHFRFDVGLRWDIKYISNILTRPPILKQKFPTIEVALQVFCWQSVYCHLPGAGFSIIRVKILRRIRQQSRGIETFLPNYPWIEFVFMKPKVLRRLRASIDEKLR